MYAFPSKTSIQSPPFYPMNKPLHFHSLGSRAALDDVARELYGGLRRIDALPASLILLELTGGTGIGRAIDDRLTRAASSIVVTTPAELTAAMQRLGPPA